MAKTLCITATDRERLGRYLSDLLVLEHVPARDGLELLQQELQSARVVEDPAQTPEDVVTMRSRVRLRNETTNTTLECTLVYPEENDAARGCVSVLAPLGAALLGHRTGETVEVDLPRGRTRFSIESMLYQPEAAGEFHR